VNYRQVSDSFANDLRTKKKNANQKGLLGGVDRVYPAARKTVNKARIVGSHIDRTGWGSI